jgi:hypothetical protein
LSDALDRELSLALGDEHVPSWASIGESVAGHALGDTLGSAASLGIQAYRQQSNLPMIDVGKPDFSDDLKIQAGQLALLPLSVQTGLSEQAATSQDGADSQETANEGVAPPAITSGTGQVAPGSGFAVWQRGQLNLSNPQDMAKLQLEDDQINLFLASRHGQIAGSPYPAPPPMSNPTEVIDYGVQLSADYWAPIHAARTSENLAVTVNGAATALDQDAQDTSNARENAAAFFNTMRNGSVGGDLAANTGTAFTDGGNAAIGAVKSAYDIVTDYPSFREAAIGVTLASIHPVTTYGHLVDSTSQWIDKPLDQQMRDVGGTGMSFLALGGAQEGLGLGVISAVNYATDLADTVKGLSTLNRDLGWLNAPQRNAAAALGELRSADAAGGAAVELMRTAVPDGASLGEEIVNPTWAENGQTPAADRNVLADAGMVDQGYSQGYSASNLGSAGGPVNADDLSAAGRSVAPSDAGGQDQLLRAATIEEVRVNQLGLERNGLASRTVLSAQRTGLPAEMVKFDAQLESVHQIERMVNDVGGRGVMLGSNAEILSVREAADVPNTGVDLDSAKSIEVALRKSPGVPNTGVAVLDAPAVSSSSFAQKMDAIRRAGFEVVADPTLGARGEFSVGKFTYNPDTMTRLDMAHEWRHFSQLQQMSGKAISISNKAFSIAQAPAEFGAYSYEESLWTRIGEMPSDEYLAFHKSQLDTFDSGMGTFRSFVAKPYNAKWRGIDW